MATQMHEPRTELLNIIPVGIQHHQHDNICHDAACQEIINLRHENGVWKVVGDKEVYLTFPSEQPEKLYYHPAANEDAGTSQYFVGYDSDGVGKIALYEFVSGVYLSETDLLLDIEVNHFTHLNNFLIASSADDEYIWVWDKGTSAYKRLDQMIKPDIIYGYQAKDTISIVPDPEKEAHATQAQLFDQFLIEKYKMRVKGYFCHSFMVMQYAFRLFDGSYILHSQPQIVKMGNSGADYYKDITDGDPAKHRYGLDIDVGIPYFMLNLDTTVRQNLEKYEGLISHFCVFATQDVSRYLLKYNPTPYSTDASKEYYLFSDNEDSVNQLMNIFPYYLVKEVKYKDLMDSNDSTQFDVSLAEMINKISYDGNAVENLTDVEKIPVRKVSKKWKWDIQNFGNVATLGLFSAESNTIYYDMEAVADNEATDDEASFVLQSQPELPIDFGTHHKFISRVQPFVYNNRLHKGDIVTRFDDSEQYSLWKNEVPGSFEREYIPNGAFKMEVKLATDQGDKWVVEDISPYVYTYAYAPTVYHLYVPNVVSYPDIRASRLRLILVMNGVARYEILNADLNQHKIYNYAYAITNKSGFESDADYLDFNEMDIEMDITDLSPHPFCNGTDADLLATDDRFYTDLNRVQVSKNSNPLVYSAFNSYQIGGSQERIKALASQSTPVSTGQFGQYPLTIFTSEGTWLLQGSASGEMLYNQIIPLNKEVAFEKSICQLGPSILYASRDGIKLLGGGDLKNMSSVLHGTPSDVLVYDTHYNLFTDNGTNYVDLIDYVSTEDFRNFMDDNVRIVFDRIHKEIIVSNDAYFENDKKYSWVFNVDTASWHKITDSWSDFIWIDSKPYGIKVANGMQRLYDIEDESGRMAAKDIMLQTRVMKLGGLNYKKIKQLVERSVFSIADKEASDAGILTKYSGHYLFQAVNSRSWKFIQGLQIPEDAYDVVEFPKMWSPHQSTRYAVLMVAMNTTDFILSHWELVIEHPGVLPDGNAELMSGSDSMGDFNIDFNSDFFNN